jgi:hypothetical protein
VDLGVLPDRAEKTVLDVIEREPLAFHDHDLAIPGPDREEPGRDLDLPDGGDRVLIKNDLHGLGVIEVDPQYARCSFLL